MTPSPTRARLRRELEAYVIQLGYSSVPLKRISSPPPEIVRVNPVRGHIMYGETVVRGDLRRRSCHERLRFFSHRQTRHRSSILFFIGVADRDRPALETLLKELDIRNNARGGHVHIVSIAEPTKRRRAPRRASSG